MKICTKCKIEQQEKDFYKNRRARDGLRSWCIKCVSDHSKKIKLERRIERDKNKRKPNSPENKICNYCGLEKRKIDFSPRSGKHKHLLRPYCKACNNLIKRNKTQSLSLEERKKIRRETYIKNKEQENRSSKTWKGNNKSRIRQYTKEYISQRLKNDVEFKLKKMLRSRIQGAVKHEFKKSKSIEYLGIDIKSYRKYIESKFKPGMSWDNYGSHGWHIDHIIPLYYFDLTNPEQQKQAFHYTNTQPLWAQENLKKNKYLVA